MKKIIAALCLSLILSLALVACGGDKKDENDTTNEGMITETGSDTNVVDRARSMVDGVENGIDRMMK